MASASDVPAKYDVVINGEGFMFVEATDQKASYGYTPTFLARQNVSGKYGDNEQDFYLTVTQTDWSGGEGQKYFRDVDGASNRFLSSIGADNRVPGRVKAFASATETACPSSNFFEACLDQYAWSDNNLYSISSAGAASSLGAHGLGQSPDRYGTAIDATSANVLYFTYDAGTIRTYNGSTFASFSSTGCTSIAYLNNTLYGIKTDGTLRSFSITGTPTTLYTWKGATGTAGVTPVKLKAQGGRLHILLTDPAELWEYDGTGVRIIAKFPDNFHAYDMEVLNGVTFVSGGFYVGGTKNYNVQAAIYYYASGTLDLLWRDNNTNNYELSTSAISLSSYTISDNANDGAFPSLIAFNNGLVFTYGNSSTEGFFTNVNFYDATNGSITNLFKNVVANSNTEIRRLACPGKYFFGFGPDATGIDGKFYTWPAVVGSGYFQTASITSSQFDFDSSLPKYIKSVLIDYEGNGTVTGAYALNGSSTFTSLGTLTSGTEVTIGQAARSVTIKLTITPTAGSTPATAAVKRLQLKAAPVLTTFRRGQYVLNLCGVDGTGHVQLRDETLHAKDGLEQATVLITAATATTPISITDRFGTFTGVIDPGGFDLREFRPEEFIAVVPVRQV